MTINWQAEVEKRKDDLLADLFDQLRIDSVRNDAEATPECPVGPGPKRALEAFLAMGERDGFKTKQVANLAGHIEYGEGEELLAVLGHVDVVPVGTGWNSDPFEPMIKDGRIYARGSSDDKGPSLAGYYALKILRDLGVPVNKRIRFIVGSDEESGWKCMQAYFQTEEMPDLGFSPDAEFPIINGEKGMVTAYIRTPAGQETDETYFLESFDAGLRENMVPQDATAIIKLADPEAMKKDFEDWLVGQAVSGQAKLDGQTLTLEVIGKASHGMAPQNGINAGTYLANFLTRYPFAKTVRNYLKVIDDLLHQEHYGEKLNLAFADEVMGPLTMNPGIFTYTPSTGGEIAVNYRFPRGMNVQQIEIKMEEAIATYGHTLALGPDKDPHYVSPEDPIVKILLEVYHKQTGLAAHEQSIGGGTYGRLMPRGVAYGALFPDSIDTMHQANEFLSLDDLWRATAIYAEALYRLATEETTFAK